MSESILTKLELLEGYRFKVDFDADAVPSMIVDEMKPVGGSLGPNPSRMLSAAVGHCLSSSLLYCLGKARVKVKKLHTRVQTDIARNKEGYRRIMGINVEISLEVEEEGKCRVPRCLDIFENYCTVTQSVRKGIEVKVNVKQL